MSGYTSEPPRPNGAHSATPQHGSPEQSQAEGRPGNPARSSSDNTVTMDEGKRSDNEDVIMDISATQKMLSAVSGSLLTSLLGTDFSFVTR